MTEDHTYERNRTSFLGTNDHAMIHMVILARFTHEYARFAHEYAGFTHKMCTISNDGSQIILYVVAGSYYMS